MATAVLGSRVRKGSARPFNRRGRGGGRAGTQRPGEGMAREGNGVSRRGIGGGAWQGRELPGKAGFMQTRGTGLVLSGGATRGRPGGICAGVRRRRGRGAGRREVGETVSGSFVNKSKFQNQFCNFKFSPSSWPQMKKY